MCSDIPLQGTCCQCSTYQPLSRVVKATASRAAGLGFDSRLLHGDLSGSSHTSDLLIGTPATTLQVPIVITSALGLVGPVSAYCDWVK